ncbi:carbon dioxide concentrating mechanism protein [Stanieria cyanosphaera PCC 7437]|uniref:Carbon dioxide concentrating mechanism protein n=1 Tax=Stanieria cyanosphaera (strain ATCC 29371 / PCC 7437) TaxID=111780 RepID=K9XPH1_STAC7|nr:carbon dioxide concentrating mechanism protein [Stanieria cyanosphaera]AFZ33946.1 carbon dioxide concentrating mechanism protein [Stanieria cyanosphaera PCC 7437]
MYLPPLQPVSNSDIRVCGDVTIHPTASIAPGVILQAGPNSSIVIEAEVCIGMGAIINAYQGSMKIKSGAILGSGVLIIGTGIIGNNACIGSATTIFNTSVAPLTVITPGSIVGDTSRQIKENQATEPTNLSQLDETENSQNLSTEENTTVLETDDFWAETSLESQPSISIVNNNGLEEKQVEESSSVSISELNGFEKIDLENHQIETQPNQSSVVGQVYINQLLLTLFPQGQAWKKNLPKKLE